MKRVRAMLASVTDAGPGRFFGAVVVGLILLGLSVHSVTREGSTEFRPFAGLFMVCLVGLGFRYRSSLTTALGLVGVGLLWALSQSKESATAAVAVGGLLTVAAIMMSWLSEPRVSVSRIGHVRRVGRLAAVLCGAAGMGLGSLQFVDRPPANRLVMLLGVAAVTGILALFFLLGDADAPETNDASEGQLSGRKGL